MNRWIFVIDTDSYAGQFERDMCAYITGLIGDCGVGDNFAILYFEDTKEEESRFIELLEPVADDKACYRPCYIWETRGWLYDGADGALPEDKFDQEEANKKHRIYTAKYHQDVYARTEKVNVDDDAYKKSGWTTESKSKALARLELQIVDCLSEKTICPRKPPYNSVAIFFYNEPTYEIINFMKKRANTFAEAKRKMGNSWDEDFKLNILGFRLLQETTSTQEIDI